MDIAYAAVTEGGTFMLDDQGVCQWALAPGDGGPESVPDRIVGAQFVASLDLSSEQGLAPLPKVGLPMLFAAVDDAGRISLVRTGRLLRWEDKRGQQQAPAPPSSEHALLLTRPAVGSAPTLPRYVPPSDPVMLRKPPTLPPPPPGAVPRRHSDVAPRSLVVPPRFPKLAARR